MSGDAAYRLLTLSQLKHMAFQINYHHFRITPSTISTQYTNIK